MNQKPLSLKTTPLPDPKVLAIALVGMEDFTLNEAASFCGLRNDEFTALLDDHDLCLRAQAEADRLLNGAELTTHRARRVLSKSIKTISDRINNQCELLTLAELIKAMELCERLVGVVQKRMAEAKGESPSMDHYLEAL